MQATKSPYRLFLKGFYCLILLFAVNPLAWGQAHKKRMLTTKDYDLWSLLIPDKVSDKGNWVSYRLYYESAKIDTVVVRQTKHDKQYIFPLATEGKFNGESDFACIARDTLLVKNLITGVGYKVPDVYNFAFSANQKFVLIILKKANNKLSFEIRDQAGKVVQHVADITYYCFDPAGNGIVYSLAKDSVYGVEMLLCKNAIVKRTIVENHKSPFQNLIWKGNTVAFIENVVADPVLFNYNLVKEKLNTLAPRRTAGFPPNMKISDETFRSPIHSGDGSKIFFWLKEPLQKSDIIDPKAVQIWNAKDKLVFDFKKYVGDYKLSDKMAIWNIDDNKVMQITDRELPCGFLSADYKHAFIYDPTAYEPNSNQSVPFDLYVADLRTGKKKLIIEYRTGDYLPLGSPDGNYLFYTKGGHCWIYDIQKDSHTNISTGLAVSFFREDNNNPVEAGSYGIGGWTKDGGIIVYDRYDLWKLSLDGKVKKRLTNGREIQQTFRMKLFNSDPFYSDIESKKNFVDLETGFLLETANKEIGKAGIGYWSSGKGVTEMVWESKKIDQVSKAKDKDIYMYLEQNFESAPRIMLYDGRAKEIVQSNKQQEQFYWGKNERIEYTVNGKKTKGVLFYPAGYKAGLKYPLVVHIYERQFAYMNDYERPSLLTADGFNVTNFTLQGYFVLYPDINYEYGNLRESVTRSVLTAVETVVGKGYIDPNKVGLIGHSFGGYETDLIITQTDRFATAVAGSAWTDLVSTYLFVSGTRRKPDFYRAEENQLRIGKSLFDDMDSYLKNSPVLLAANVKTPLLGWVGEEDRHIHSLQSMEFYLALRRLNKEHTLLVYPGEEHTVDQKENAIDLNVRIMQWFDYYLKNGKKQDWMKSK